MGNPNVKVSSGGKRLIGDDANRCIAMVPSRPTRRLTTLILSISRAGAHSCILFTCTNVLSWLNFVVIFSRYKDFEGTVLLLGVLVLAKNSGSHASLQVLVLCWKDV